MWAREIEFMLACWLSISPFIFGYPKDAIFFWLSDLACSSLLAFCALISYYKPLRKMHLCNLIVAFYLISLSFLLRGSPHYEPLQNYMALGVLLLMISIVPTEAEKPPIPWREFYEKMKK
ncbi:MAG: hypothetical protein KR126chlam3_00709 [Chlamydiae bacterium]|nr:hypothetical protein [Chlamydiota bacterium]